jgi:rRNA processing protein Krr1/Pno1
VYEYVSRIIACDVTGLEISDGYGFDPNNVDKEATSKLEVEKKEVPSVVPPSSEGISDIDKQIELKKLDIESDKLKIAKADKMLELLKAGVPYEDAKKILGI